MRNDTRERGRPPHGDYPWIRAWGWMMGSMEYYIVDEIARAKSSNAPLDAIFRRMTAGGEWDGKTWARASEIENSNTRYVLEREFGPLPKGDANAKA